MSWLRASIRNKLLTVLGVGLLVVLAGGGSGFLSANESLDRMAVVNHTIAVQAREIADTALTFKEQVQEWKDTLLRGGNPKDFDHYWGAFVAKEKAVSDSANRLQREVELPKAKKLLADFIAAHDELGRRYRAGLEAFKASGFDPHSGDAAVRGLDRAPTELLKQTVKVLRGEAMAEIGSAHSNARRMLHLTLWITAVLIVLSVVACARMLVSMVVKPIATAARMAETVARGDLTVKVETSSQDEIGRLLAALDRMRDGLAESVRSIQVAAENVNTGSREIARGNADLSSRTEEQASSLEETASSMEELTTTVKQNADNARQASQLAAGASDVAVRGGDVVRRVVDTMSGISDSSKKISDIITVIDGIAFQTNILALNAAVEAARAGEQGRGFAVVASEVRALAQRSAAAAKEIKGLIEESVSRVQDGTKLVDGAGNTMEEIVGSVKRVTDIVAEISAASQEQLRGIEQVGRALTQMDQVVQQNAALVEESAAAAENLAGQAEVLSDSAARFKLDGAGPTGTARPALQAVPAQPAKKAEPAPLPRARAPRLEPARPQGRALPHRAARGEGRDEDGEWKEF